MPGRVSAWNMIPRARRYHLKRTRNLFRQIQTDPLPAAARASPAACCVNLTNCLRSRGTSLELSPSTCSSCVNRLRVWDIRRFTEAGRSPSHPGAGAPRALVASTPMIPCAGDVQLQLPVAVHFLVDKSAPRLLAGSA